jgi:dCTP deaminase
MILSRVAIQAEIAAKRLTVEPMDDSQIGVSSIDLTLGSNLLVMPDAEHSGSIIEPSKPGFEVMSEISCRGRSRPIPSHDPYIIKPRELVLGWTRERLSLANSLAARVEGKSTLARLGLSAHITAPTVMAGFKGVLCLEMYNCGPYQIKVEESMAIAQLVLEQVESPPREGYSGTYQNQAIPN